MKQKCNKLRFHLSVFHPYSIRIHYVISLTIKYKVHLICIPSIYVPIAPCSDGGISTIYVVAPLLLYAAVRRMQNQVQ